MLLEENRTWRGNSDPGCCYQKARRRKEQENDSAYKINHLFENPLPGSFQSRVENQYRATMKFVEGRLRNLGVKEISHEPGFHPLQFASLNGLFHLAKITVFRIYDNAP